MTPAPLVPPVPGLPAAATAPVPPLSALRELIEGELGGADHSDGGDVQQLESIICSKAGARVRVVVQFDASRTEHADDVAAFALFHTGHLAGEIERRMA